MDNPLYSDYRSLIRFIPANQRKDPSAEPENQNDKASTITGEQAKHFYESLTTETERDRFKNTCKQKKSTRNEETNGKNSSIFTSDKRENNEVIQIDSDDSEFDHLTRKYSKRISKVTRKSESQINGQDLNRNRLSPAKQQCESPKIHETDKLAASFHSKLLMFSQNGELSELKKLFRGASEVHYNIDYTDRYGWTALMCAAVAGHGETVTYLLSKGANKYTTNTQGQTAADLAAKKGLINIRDLIYLHTNSVAVDLKTNIKKEKFFCKVCKSEFTDSDEKKHTTSTLHLFNMKLKPYPDPFMIPESNVGYKIMKQSGWDGEQGLGSEGQGQKYPVKTSLKRDRLCIGATSKDKQKAKVTHFGPNDKEAVSSVHKHSQRIMSARASSKRARKHQEQKDRRWERNMRNDMNFDL